MPPTPPTSPATQLLPLVPIALPWTSGNLPNHFPLPQVTPRSPSTKTNDDRAPPSPWIRAHAASELLKAREGVHRASRRCLHRCGEGIDPRGSVADASFVVFVDGRRTPSSISSPSEHPRPPRRFCCNRGEQAHQTPSFSPSFASSSRNCHGSRAPSPPWLTSSSPPCLYTLVRARNVFPIATASQRARPHSSSCTAPSSSSNPWLRPPPSLKTPSSWSPPSSPACTRRHARARATSPWSRRLE